MSSEKRTRNLQVKVTPSFYDELERVAEACNMPVSVLGAFGLRMFMDSFNESHELNYLIAKNVEKFLQSVDEK